MDINDLPLQTECAMNPVGYRLRLYKHQLYECLFSPRYNLFYRACTSNQSTQSTSQRLIICNRARQRIWVLCILFTMCCILFMWQNYEYRIDGNVEDTLLFEPDLKEDFPVGVENVSKIEKVIHWTYKDTIISPEFYKNMRSFVEKNPGWAFYFWTDEGSRQFIMDTHPELLPTYDSYLGDLAHIKRADFIRYVVLYELGGIYVDLDVLDLRPLDRLMSKYTCIFPPEPFEHAVLLWHTPYLINNAIMICQAKHPFLKLILESLPYFQNLKIVNDATGPNFLATVYKMYNKIGFDVVRSEKDVSTSKTDNSPYFYKGLRSDDQPDSVYIPNSQYFCTSVDPKSRKYYGVCYDPADQNDLQKRACANLIERDMSPVRNRFTFMEHQFYASYGSYKLQKLWDLYFWMFAIDIRDLVPNLQIYESK